MSGALLYSALGADGQFIFYLLRRTMELSDGLRVRSAKRERVGSVLMVIFMDGVPVARTGCWTQARQVTNGALDNFDWAANFT